MPAKLRPIRLSGVASHPATSRYSSPPSRRRAPTQVRSRRVRDVGNPPPRTENAFGLLLTESPEAENVSSVIDPDFDDLCLDDVLGEAERCRSLLYEEGEVGDHTERGRRWA